MAGGFNSIFSRGEARYKNSIHYLSPDLFGVRIAGSYGMDETLANGGRPGSLLGSPRSTSSTPAASVFAGRLRSPGQHRRRHRQARCEGLGMQNTGGRRRHATNFYKATLLLTFANRDLLGSRATSGAVYGYANFI